MDYRIAGSGDIDGILELHARNLVTNLTDEQKKNGFVTTPFTTEQLDSLVARAGLFVADDNGAIKAYAVAAGWDYFDGRPMFDLMLELFTAIRYKNFMIDREHSFQYGPVCVDEALRGRGVFPRLFGAMKAEMARYYPVGATFINKINTRSVRAHTGTVNMDIINEFRFNNNDYYGLAFLTKD